MKKTMFHGRLHGPWWKPVLNGCTSHWVPYYKMSIHLLIIYKPLLRIIMKGHLQPWGSNWQVLSEFKLKLMWKCLQHINYLSGVETRYHEDGVAIYGPQPGNVRSSTITCTTILIILKLVGELKISLLNLFNDRDCSSTSEIWNHY